MQVHLWEREVGKMYNATIGDVKSLKYISPSLFLALVSSLPEIESPVNNKLEHLQQVLLNAGGGGGGGGAAAAAAGAGGPPRLKNALGLGTGAAIESGDPRTERPPEGGRGGVDLKDLEGHNGGSGALPDSLLPGGGGGPPDIAEE